MHFQGRFPRKQADEKKWVSRVVAAYDGALADPENSADLKTSLLNAELPVTYDKAWGRTIIQRMVDDHRDQEHQIILRKAKSMWDEIKSEFEGDGNLVAELRSQVCKDLNIKEWNDDGSEEFA